MKRSKIVVRIEVFYYCEYSTIGCEIWGVGNVEKTPCRSRASSSFYLHILKQRMAHYFYGTLPSFYRSIKFFRSHSARTTSQQSFPLHPNVLRSCRFPNVTGHNTFPRYRYCLNSISSSIFAKLPSTRILRFIRSYVLSTIYFSKFRSFTQFFRESSDRFPFNSLPCSSAAPGQLGFSFAFVFPIPLPPEVAKGIIVLPEKS